MKMISKGRSSPSSELETVKSLGKIAQKSQQKNLHKSPSAFEQQKKHIKVEANQVKSKMGKFMEKYKNRMGEVKKTHLGLNFNFNFKSLKNNGNIGNQSTGISLFRSKNNFILQKGFNPSAKKNQTAPTGSHQLKKMEKNKKQNPESNASSKYIGVLKDSISTNSSFTSKIKISNIFLDDFDILKKVGAGKYGQVFMVRHKTTKMNFAMKKITKADIDEIGKRQLTYEIKIQTFIDHPNIVKLYGFFQNENYIYLVLELCSSGHLYDFLQQKTFLPQKTVQNIIKQVCQALKHLHNNHIIHRDLKLQNVLFQMGMIKICDFGWSIETEDLRQTFCGTPLYIAPQILQQKGYDHKIDIWCLGIMTFELLYGRVPFQIKEQQDFQKIVFDDVDFPDYPYISNEGKKFVSQCLTKDPQFRPNLCVLQKMPFIQECDPMILDELF